MVSDDAKEMTFEEACRTVAHWCPDGYAKAYAYAGLDHRMEGEEARVQCLYILNNMTRWRGDKAKAARAALKRLSREKK